MTSINHGNGDCSICVEKLHEAHPKIRARDWRSPLVARLTSEKPYKDGFSEISTSYKANCSEVSESPVQLSWAGLAEDYEQCINTYQEPVITEFAALAVACILCESKAELEITEVTRRGEKVDYWLGDRELLLEVSGTQSGNLESLCEAKAT